MSLLANLQRRSEMMTATTTRQTVHGNPGEKRILEAGTRIQIEPATNLPSDSPIKWWASPLASAPWNIQTAQWAADIGVGLTAEDVTAIAISGPWT